jgi:glycerol-3-phosphate acyltransferase PlsY
MWRQAVLLVGMGYFAGSVPFGVLLTRWFTGLDVRAAGSGNIGATNVARVGGKKLGILVLGMDAAKGALPVLLSIYATDQRWIHAATGLAAFLGHVFPVWLRFRGGKGVATALGVLGVLVPDAAVVGAAVYALLFALFRVSSIGSLAGGISALVVTWVRQRPLEYQILTAVLFALILYTHRGNIGRLLKRTERSL